MIMNDKDILVLKKKLNTKLNDKNILQSKELKWNKKTDNKFNKNIQIMNPPDHVLALLVPNSHMIPQLSPPLPQVMFHCQTSKIHTF